MHKTRTGWDLAPKHPPQAQSHFASGWEATHPVREDGRFGKEKGGIWPPHTHPWPNHISPPA
ncbi:MAG: hypothetical protein EBT75_02935 [Proteobacteria bacterium]|nr:hypothetical protein [Pseudomonadota bacterium]